VTAEELRSEADHDGARRQVPVAWEALEDAFENNAPEVHSYLHMGTGEVVRVVDGIADPATHARIATDSTYLRVDPVSSREQYRWMERFIATVEEGPLRTKLLQAIDGKGAFRRFKDVLMAFPVDRERWFTFRSERLRTCMEGWLDAQGVTAVQRAEWHVPTAEEVKPQVEVVPEKVVRRVARPSAAEGNRRRLHELAEALPARELETALAFLEFLRDRRPLPRASMRERDEAHDQDDPRDRHDEARDYQRDFHDDAEDERS
jgi:hypothetical protein